MPSFLPAAVGCVMAGGADATLLAVSVIGEGDLWRERMHPEDDNICNLTTPIDQANDHIARVRCRLSRGLRLTQLIPALRRVTVCAFVLILVSVIAVPAMVFAQTDEIQVYNAEIEPPGIFNLMLHSNFTPVGRTTPVFPGAIIANHSFQETAEWAYGVTPWMEQGLYLPLTSPYTANHGATINGFKIRELFVRPDAHDHRFFYGLNFEFSVNANYWEDKRTSSELRPIVGVHLHPWDFIYNPIVDTDYTGGFGNLQYNPAGRVAYNLNDKWAIAAEEYDGFGPLRHFVPYHQQFHEIWAVLDHNSSKFLGIDVEAGVGFGLTPGSDKITLKLMLSRNLNSHLWRP